MSHPMIDVPVVSLNDFKNLKQRSLFASTLAKSFEQFGFVGMTETGVPEMLPLADRLSREVLAIGPDLLEERYGRSGNLRQRGWTGKGIEQAKGRKKPDPKQHWMTANPEIMDPSTDPLDRRHGPSLQVEEVPEFTPVMEKMLQKQQIGCRAALSALELHYRLPEGSVLALNERADSVLRTLWYDKGLQDGSELAAAHLDINLITVLASSQIEGLQLKVNGVWRTVRTVPGVVYVNIGEMLVEIPGLTRLTPMLHRVLATREMAEMRIVYAYFGHAKRDRLLDPSRHDTRVDVLFQRRIREITRG